MSDSLRSVHIGVLDTVGAAICWTTSLSISAALVPITLKDGHQVPPVPPPAASLEKPAGQPAKVQITGKTAANLRKHAAAYEMNRAGGTELAATSQFADLRVLHLMKALEAESDFGFRSGRLYLDSVPQALAVLILQSRSTMPRLFRPHRGGLAPTKLKRVLEYVDGNLDREISLTNLAEAAGLSAAHLCNAFRHSTGKSPHQFVMHARIERAKDLLRRPGLRVIDAAVASGFKNPQHFARVFRSACHLTPTQYKTEYMPKRQEVRS